MSGASLPLKSSRSQVAMDGLTLLSRESQVPGRWCRVIKSILVGCVNQFKPGSKRMCFQLRLDSILPSRIIPLDVRMC